MDYKLAKQLKDAGFLQYGAGHNIWPIGYDSMLHDSSIEVYKPTLSELIESCGESIGSLFQLENGWGAESELYKLESIGNTPEMAVANLWLLLNNK